MNAVSPSGQSSFLKPRDFTAGLNDEQRAVVLGGDGPCVVLAGAGSGKTRTIVHRVAHLIAGGVPAHRILLLTFTNKAAAEMMSRIGELLGSPFAGSIHGAGGGGVHGGTFHSVANRMLRAFAADIGYTPSFSILDEEDAKDLLKASLKSLGLGGDAKRFPSSSVLKELFSYAVNAMVPLEQAVESKHPRWLQLITELRSVRETYESKKRAANAMDFDDLLVQLLRLLDGNPVVRERIAGRFDYLLVDEYQDTNPLQARLVGLLAAGHRNVLVVGDDAQSIYSFRAADVRNILDFPKQYPGAKVFKLETNYRSTPEILELANDVIARNREQFPKELRSVKGSGVRPVVAPAGSASQEAMFIAERVAKALDSGTPSQEIAVLFRATFHSQALEFELMKRGIEYDYRGGLKFFDRAHVKDALAFVRIAANFQDEAAWLRVLSLQEGVGEVMAGKIFAMMRAAGSLAGAVLAPVEQSLGARSAKGWRALRPILEEIRAAEGKPAAIVQAVLDSSYADYLESQYPNWRERLEDVGQLKEFAAEYEDAAALLSEITLDDSSFKSAGVRGQERERTRRIPKIALSTIHQAKGLEWDTVFLIHLTNSSFPNRKAALEEGGMEEERRLFYVAVTRAKRHLYLTYPATLGRDSFGLEQPSQFLEECDPHCLDMGLVEKSGWGFGGGSSFGGVRSGSRDEGSSGWSGDDSDSGGFHDDEAVDVDYTDPFGEMKSRVADAKKDWKKKSFLRDV